MLPDELSFFASGREPVRAPPLTSPAFFYASERQPVRAPLVTRVVAGTLAFMAAMSVALTPIAASAVEIPAPPSAFELQTSGPNGAPTVGDWYSPTVAGAGAGYHYLTFNVPCGWPAASPVYVDLFSPEMNRVSGALATSEEPAGAYDSTQFELYGPGATVGPGFASPAPGAGIAGTQITYQPGAAGVAEAWRRFATLAAPVTCGNYVVRSAVLASDPLNPGGTGDDQNGWKIRVGTDNDNVADERAARELRQPGRRHRHERRDHGRRGPGPVPAGLRCRPVPDVLRVREPGPRPRSRSTTSTWTG